MVTTTPEQKNNAIQFMNIINKIETELGKVNNDKLKSLFNDLRQTDLFKKTEVQKRAHASKRQRYSRQYMMAHPKDFKLCTRCDTYVVHNNLVRHQKTKKCKDIFSKKVVAKGTDKLVLDQNELVASENNYHKNLKYLRKEECGEENVSSSSESESEEEVEESSSSEEEESSSSEEESSDDEAEEEEAEEEEAEEVEVPMDAKESSESESSSSEESESETSDSDTDSDFPE